MNSLEILTPLSTASLGSTLKNLILPFGQHMSKYDMIKNISNVIFDNHSDASYGKHF